MNFKIIFFILCCFWLPQFIYSQNHSIRGNLKDSTHNYFHSNAVVSVLSQIDSSLVKFKRSDANGDFFVEGLPAGAFILLVTYPSYADFVGKFSLTDVSTLDFKQIYLTPKAKLMEEIILKRTAIVIKGDTTEYKADSFRVKLNASVEDLLKELPGIQVDKEGKITAQGQRVQKVLLDGEEFFSDDPTLVTRNLRAESISKVQVFYKKSDQSAFTGIEDGEITKTINLELKADARKGYFGKVAAAGSDENYNGQAFINSFKGKRKLSAFAILSNTDKTGLNFNESLNYGFDNESLQVDEGSGTIFINQGETEELGAQNYIGEGLPESIKGGLHFSNKWKQDLYQVNGHYLFNKLAEKGAEKVFRQNILQDSVYYTRDNSTRHSDKLRHSLAGVFETQIDPSSSLKFSAKGYAGNFKKATQYQSTISGQENKLINQSLRNLTQEGDNFYTSAHALYRKKFKKKGNTFTLLVDNTLYENDTKGYLYTTSQFYPAQPFLPLNDSTDQFKKNNSNQNIFSTKATYTQPLSERSFLEINYLFRNNHSNLELLSFNKDINSKYVLLVDNFSNHFDYNYNSHSGGLNYRFNEMNYYFSFGGNVSNTNVTQRDLLKDSGRKYDYFNFSPQFVFNYKLNPSSNFNIKYTGTTHQPTIQQLQPLRNNYDPLNIIIGNPLLTEEFESEVQLTYSNYQVLNERYLFLSSFFIHTGNMISSSYTVEKSGRRIAQYINVDEGFAASFGGGYSIRIPKTSVRLALGPAFNYSKYTNFINGARNATITTSLALRLNAKVARDNYDLFATIMPTYNQSNSSLSLVSSTTFTNYSFNVGGKVSLASKWEVGSDININIRQKINQYDLNNNVILWEAYLERKFLKHEGLALRLSVNDILDQNKGYDRYQHPFYYEERNYLTLRRYWLLGLTYNFMNKGGKAVTEDGTIHL